MPGDLRHALRTLRRAPLVFAASVLTLALGTGLATGVLAVAYGALLRPLPYPDPDRLVAITIHQRGDENRNVGLRLDEFDRWRARLRAFDSVGGYIVAEATLRGAGDRVHPCARQRGNGHYGGTGFFTRRNGETEANGENGVTRRAPSRAPRASRGREG